jgi:hypothetical protein
MQSRRQASRRLLLAVVITAPIASWPSVALSSDAVSELINVYRAQVDRRLELPAHEAKYYEELIQAALLRADISLITPQYLLVIDRNPYVQVSLLAWRSAQGEFRWIGVSPVSTGIPGFLNHFETPTGVFAHTLTNPDFRSDGAATDDASCTYGPKGMRVFDFGLHKAPRGWGDGALASMRLQMHSDFDTVEFRLGVAQTRGCIHIPESLNRFLDRYGVIDAEYEQAARERRTPSVLDPRRQTVSDPGRYLIVIDSDRKDRPDWSPAPYIPRRKLPTKDPTKPERR